MKKTGVVLGVVMLFTHLLWAQDPIINEGNGALNFARPVEGTINYKKDLLKQEFDYELMPVGDRSFKLKFVNQPSDYLDIKIYDIIGNLILTESVKQARDSELEYQFDKIKSKIFVIKVKSGKANLTKKINL